MANDLKRTGELLDELSGMIDGAQNALFFSGKIKVDEKRAKEIIKEIHLSLPKGMQVADTVLEERDKIEANALQRADDTINEANIKAKELLMRAKKEAEKLIAQDYITNEARNTAKEIVGGAKAISEDLKLGINRYFNSVLDKLEADVKATEEKIATINQELEKHREYLDMNKSKINDFMMEFDKNVEEAQIKLAELISEHLGNLTQK